MPQESLFIAAGVGATLGAIVSSAYRLNQKRLNEASKEALGLSTNDFINYTLVGALSGLFVVFSSLAIMVKDSAFPRESPGPFLLETVAMSLVPAALLFVSAYLREGKLASQSMNFVLLSLKFAIAHLMLQYSGYYSYVFG